MAKTCRRNFNNRQELSWQKLLLLLLLTISFYVSITQHFDTTNTTNSF